MTTSLCSIHVKTNYLVHKINKKSHELRRGKDVLGSSIVDEIGKEDADGNVELK